MCLFLDIFRGVRLTRGSIPDGASSLPENRTKHGCRQREQQQLFLNICFISQILPGNIYRNRISYKGGAGCGRQGKLDLQADSRMRKPTSELCVQSKQGPESVQLGAAWERRLPEGMVKLCMSFPGATIIETVPLPTEGTGLREDTTTISRDVEGNQASLEIGLAGNCTRGWKSLQGCRPTRHILIHGPLPASLGKFEASTLSRSQRSPGSPFMIL